MLRLVRARAVRVVVVALARPAIRVELAGVASLIWSTHAIGWASRHQCYRSGERRNLRDSLAHDSPPSWSGPGRRASGTARKRQPRGHRDRPTRTFVYITTDDSIRLLWRGRV